MNQWDKWAAEEIRWRRQREAYQPVDMRPSVSWWEKVAAVVVSLGALALAVVVYVSWAAIF